MTNCAGGGRHIPFSSREEDMARKITVLHNQLKATQRALDAYSIRFFELHDKASWLLEVVTDLMDDSCEFLHHTKQHRHKDSMDCPVEKLVRQAKQELRKALEGGE